MNVAVEHFSAQTCEDTDINRMQTCRDILQLIFSKADKSFIKIIQSDEVINAAYKHISSNLHFCVDFLRELFSYISSIENKRKLGIV